jgi:hypothetical protein
MQAPADEHLAIRMRCHRCGRVARDATEAASRDWLIFVAEEHGELDFDITIVYCRNCADEEFRLSDPVQSLGTK